MAKVFATATVLAVGCVCSAFAANPLGFPSYAQQVEVTYATEAEAAAATIEVTPLFGDAPAAFGSRWDDSSPAHRAKGEMLARAGIRGTFFPNGSEGFLEKTAPYLRSLGHAIGNHTTHHPFMMEPSANLLFREILGQRIRAESLADTTLVSYVSPYGWGGSPDSERLPLIRQILLDTGHYMTSDNPPAKAGLDPKTWFVTRIFSANDREPDAALFASNLAVRTQLVLDDPSVPRLTFGIHSWCKSEGNDLQEGWLKGVKSSHPDWWYANDNEYAAYRYEFLNGGVVPAGAKGKTAVFRVKRYNPAQIGAAVPLSLRIAGTPVSVSVDGAELAVGAKGTWTLPPSVAKALPAKVDLAAADGALAEFPGLTLTVSNTASHLEATLVNGTSSDLTDVFAVGYLPPSRRKGRVVLPVTSVKRGETKVFRFNLGPSAVRSDYRFGMALYAVSVDFSAAGAAGRAWATTEVFTGKSYGCKKANPNDAAVVAGPLDEAKVDDAALAALSKTDSVLTDFGDAAAERWRRGGDIDRVPFVAYADAPYAQKDSAIAQAVRAAKRPGRTLLAAFDFETTSGCKRVYFTGWTRPYSNWTALYVDGRQVPLTRNGRAVIPVAEAGGRHRLVARWKQPSDVRHEHVAMISVSGEPDDFAATLPCRPIRFFPGADFPPAENVPALMKPGTTAEEWEKLRRPELLETFTREEFGRRPVERPADLRFERTAPDEEAFGGRAIVRHAAIVYRGPGGEGRINVKAWIPESDRPVPAFVQISPRALEDLYPDEKKIHEGYHLPADLLTSRGFAAIGYCNQEVAFDGMPGLTDTVFRLFGPSLADRKPDSWGVLSAWAWGASRVMDWIEQEPLIDAKHVGVAGLSRNGKTALWAGITDTRFAMACSCCSGAAGAKLNHMDLPYSESVPRIYRVFPYWFCPNYEKWGAVEKEMPFDQHQLLALMAPRLVVVTSATEDDWAGQFGEFKSAEFASPAWELYGRKGLVKGVANAGPDGFPPPNTALNGGSVSYHIRNGRHTQTHLDWNSYMDLAEKHGWKPAVATTGEIGAFPGEKHVVVYDGVKPDKWCVSTGTVRPLADGRLAAFFFCGGLKEPSPENTGVVCYSSDDGDTWTAPVTTEFGFPREGHTISQAITTVFPLKDGRLLVFLRTHGGNHRGDWRSWYGFTSDGGKTVTDVKPLPAPLEKSTYIRTCLRRKDGALVAVSQHYTDDKPLLHPVLGAIISKDEGRTWSAYGRMELPDLDPQHTIWAEPTIAELSDGRIVMLIRHGRMGHKCLFRAYSDDGGETWPAVAEKTDIPNPSSRVVLVALGGDRLALLHNASPHKRMPLSLWISEDGTKTWSYKRTLLSHNCDNTKTSGALHGLNYPEAFLSSDGKWLYAVFDNCRHRCDFMKIRLPER